MKKLILHFAIVLFASFAWANVEVTWTYDGTDADGFTLYWWRSSDPATRWNMNAPSGTARTMNLLEAWFLPATEYSFEMEAYNSVDKGPMSNVYKWMCTLPGYSPPIDSLPPENTVAVPPVYIPNGMQLEGIKTTYEFVPVP